MADKLFIQAEGGEWGGEWAPLGHLAAVQGLSLHPRPEDDPEAIHWWEDKELMKALTDGAPRETMEFKIEPQTLDDEALRLFFGEVPERRQEHSLTFETEEMAPIPRPQRRHLAKWWNPLTWYRALLDRYFHFPQHLKFWEDGPKEQLVTHRTYIPRATITPERENA